MPTPPPGPPSEVACVARRGSGRGSIILMHCGPAITPRLLPGVIRHYACAGYTFATVERLLARDAGVRAQVDCGIDRGPATQGTAVPTTRLERLEVLVTGIAHDLVALLLRTPIGP